MTALGWTQLAGARTIGSHTKIPINAAKAALPLLPGLDRQAPAWTRNGADLRDHPLQVGRERDPRGNDAPTERGRPPEGRARFHPFAEGAPAAGAGAGGVGAVVVVVEVEVVCWAKTPTAIVTVAPAASL